MSTIRKGFFTFRRRENGTAGGNITQAAGGSIDVNGTLTVSTVPLMLNGGPLQGGGQVSDSVNNVGGTVSAGSGPSAADLSLAITGDYTQGASGFLLVQLGGPGAGTGYDFLDIGGTANLGGTLQISTINGFDPGAGTFRFLEFGNRVGDFANVFSTDPNVQYTVSYDATGGYVTAFSVFNAPEPGSGAFIAAGLLPLAGGLLLRRRLRGGSGREAKNSEETTSAAG